jgi:hypothetical protein
MKHTFTLLIALTCTLLVGCAHSIALVNFNSGETLAGEYNSGTREISVIMPNGETLKGQYSAASNASVSYGTGFASSGGNFASGFGTSVSSGGASQAYALLRSSTSKLMMEMVVTYGSNGQGFGEARTNDGRTYKVQF